MEEKYEVIAKLKTIKDLLGDLDSVENPTSNEFTMQILDPQNVRDAIVSTEFHDLGVKDARLTLSDFAELIDGLIENMPLALEENDRRNIKQYLK